MKKEMGTMTATAKDTLIELLKDPDAKKAIETIITDQINHNSPIYTVIKNRTRKDLFRPAGHAGFRGGMLPRDWH
jgi:hypothetical protein